jgi:hypothetical protein
MHTAAGIRGGARRRRPIRRIVLFAILLLALVEPLIMYRSLVRERAQRRAVADSSLVNPGVKAGDGSGR